uniref:Paladin n=1 Tax=Sus scrofa TaxID=9823 RepID=A0A8D0ZKP5_PIG
MPPGAVGWQVLGPEAAGRLWVQRPAQPSRRSQRAPPLRASRTAARWMVGTHSASTPSRPRACPTVRPSPSSPTRWPPSDATSWCGMLPRRRTCWALSRAVGPPTSGRCGVGPLCSAWGSPASWDSGGSSRNFRRMDTGRASSSVCGRSPCCFCVLKRTSCPTRLETSRVFMRTSRASAPGSRRSAWSWPCGRRYHRLPLPEQGAPLEAQFDAFVSVLRETPSLLLLRDAHGPPPAFLFSCQTGVGRTNLGMVLGTLVLFHHSGTALRPESVPTKTKALAMEQLQVVQSFLHLVPQGRRMVEEVDRAIAACAELHDLKEVVLENQKELEGVRLESLAQGSGSQHGVRQRALWSLERYFYLILFNYYLHEQYPLAFALSFSRWLCAHPELYRLPMTLSSVEPVAPGDLIATGSLGVDDLISPDALSTVREMDVANFRRVPRMPIYGTAQPSAKALGSILAYLTDTRRKLRQVVWVSLREEAVLECDGHTHSLRWPGPPMAPHQLENLETQLKAHLSTPLPGAEGPRTRRFQTCLTMQEVFSQQRGACPGLTYHRIPVPDFCAPREEDFDRLLEALQAALAKDPGTGFVFSCLSGQGRTTTAMVVAVLVFWHIQGFPEVGEEELVSVPDAKFTKGEFEVVMKVVQLLPDGHRVKKEVDAALDTVSETMTPMHYHLREIIICTFRQARAARSEREARRLQLRSVQYLERYICLVLFNAYLHLEKAGSWQRPFSVWMREVAAKAGIYEILNQLGFPELESVEDQPFSRLRCRWQEQSHSPEPSAAGDFL